MIMQACKTHDECVVVFAGDNCPLCKVQEMLDTTIDELEKAMIILKKLKFAAEECSLFV
jgi:hypothetical protein